MTWDSQSDSTQCHGRGRMEVNELTSPPPWTRLLPVPTSLLSYTHWQAYTQTPTKTVGLNDGTEPRMWRLKEYQGATNGFPLSPWSTQQSLHVQSPGRRVVATWPKGGTMLLHKSNGFLLCTLFWTSNLLRLNKVFCQQLKYVAIDSKSSKTQDSSSGDHECEYQIPLIFHTDRRRS